jgi:membrane protein
VIVGATDVSTGSPAGHAPAGAPPRSVFRFTDTKLLLVSTFEAWYRHNAPRLGASLAFYTILSLAPLLIVVIAAASLLFGRTAAENQIVWQIQDLVGREGAEVVRQMMEGARKPTSGILATLIGLLALFMGATAVVVELRDALNTIWEIPAKERHWQWSLVNLLRERVLSFLIVLGVGFLLIMALTMNAWLAAAEEMFSDLPPCRARSCSVSIPRSHSWS